MTIPHNPALPHHLFSSLLSLGTSLFSSRPCSRLQGNPSPRPRPSNGMTFLGHRRQKLNRNGNKDPSLQQNESLFPIFKSFFYFLYVLEMICEKDPKSRSKKPDSIRRLHITLHSPNVNIHAKLNISIFIISFLLVCLSIPKCHTVQGN